MAEDQIDLRRACLEHILEIIRIDDLYISIIGFGNSRSFSCIVRYHSHLAEERDSLQLVKQNLIFLGAEVVIHADLAAVQDVHALAEVSLPVDDYALPEGLVLACALILKLCELLT